MFDIDGISHSTLVTYYGYRKARVKVILFSCDSTEVPGLRNTLHVKAGTGLASEFQNHETFVLRPDSLSLPVPILAITFSDNKAHFGVAVSVRDWDISQ